MNHHEIINEHRYFPDFKSLNCICKSSKQLHKYKSHLNVVKFSESDEWGYSGTIERLPFYVREENQE